MDEEVGTVINAIADDMAFDAVQRAGNVAHCGRCQRHQPMATHGHILPLPQGRALTLECEVCAVCGALCYVLVSEDYDSDEAEGGAAHMIDWTVDPPQPVG